MRRRTGSRRPGWEQTVSDQGLVYQHAGAQPGGGRPYWDEAVHYEFGLDEILLLETQVETLHSMCLDAIDHVITTERFADFSLDPQWIPAVVQSWQRNEPSLYGRFDLRYDGSGPAKLLEYNADTPTSLLEASVVQWWWRGDTAPEADQWNSLHERLVARWREIAAQLASSTVHFTWTTLETSGEDHMTVAYIQETAAEAGLHTVGIAIEDLGWDERAGRFVDLAGDPIEVLFKLYPWEWIAGDPFGPQAIRSMAVGERFTEVRAAARSPAALPHPVAPVPTTLWIEPAWKMLLSNKALLAVLWQLYPDHPFLLPAYLDHPGWLSDYVRKPKLGREGANITIVGPAGTQTTAGDYGAEGYVYQLFEPLPAFDGYHPVLGAWIVGAEAAGLGIRETVGLITDDTATFVPHLIRD